VSAVRDRTWIASTVLRHETREKKNTHGGFTTMRYINLLLLTYLLTHLLTRVDRRDRCDPIARKKLQGAAKKRDIDHGA